MGQACSWLASLHTLIQPLTASNIFDKWCNVGLADIVIWHFPHNTSFFLALNIDYVGSEKIDIVAFAQPSLSESICVLDTGLDT